MEASGTSGMKAAHNGVINFSVAGRLVAGRLHRRRNWLGYRSSSQRTADGNLKKETWNFKTSTANSNISFYQHFTSKETPG